VVAGLRGDVLDVGCGEGRYDDVLAPLAQRGVIRYVGLEPSLERVEALRARWPWATVREGSAESIDERAAYDHVLVLRSWNHLRDPERAVDALLAALRPGGTLTVVDNVAFGLLRSGAHAARAQEGSATFEHYRNDDAEKAHARIARRGFELVGRHDVGPTTSDQWMLRYCAPRGASVRAVDAPDPKISRLNLDPSAPGS
jgi:SAM-dependent methyltransferase